MTVMYDVRTETDADYLNLLARKIFHANFNKVAIDRRWPSFEAAFHHFQPERVAAMTDDEFEDLAANTELIRNRVKLRAVITNAKRFVQIAATHGSWRAWLSGLRDATYEEREVALATILERAGPTTIFYFLFEAGEAELSDKPDGVR